MKDEVIDAAYGAGWSVVKGMPESVARRQFDGIADAIWWRNGAGPQQLQANLARVRPDATGYELKKLTRAGLRSYLRYWCEIFQLPKLGVDEIIARIDPVGEKLLRDAVAAGNGMILALPHMGNWDHAGAWLAGTGVPFTTVAERLKPESLFERFVAFRESLGMEVIPLTGGERPPVKILSDRLRSGGVLCLLADRDLTAAGIEVDFFGHAARMPAGPAALALHTGAVLLPVTVSYPSRYRTELVIHDQIQVPADGERAEKVQAMTQRLADVFAGAITAHPADWHMLQKIWTTDLDPRRLASQS